MIKEVHVCDRCGKDGAIRATLNEEGPKALSKRELFDMTESVLDFCKACYKELEDWWESETK